MFREQTGRDHCVQSRAGGRKVAGAGLGREGWREAGLGRHRMKGEDRNQPEARLHGARAAPLSRR